MFRLTEKALRVLEFNKILSQLADYALTDLGKEKCRQLVPLSDFSEIQKAQSETEEAVVILSYQGGNPLCGFTDVRPYLSLAQKGSTLSQKALLLVAEALRAARSARSSLVTERENTPLITAKASRLQAFRQLEEDITGAILSEEEMSDHASPALYDIRRNIAKANEKVRTKLSQMVRGEMSKYLQEAIVTVRNGRYVIPVRSEFRSNVPGIVQDQSSTGATLFVEPLAVVELSNEIREWTAKEREEIERILAALSAAVGEKADMIEQNIVLLTHLDFVFAKGQLARQMRAVSPKLNQDGIIRLVRVRHPLIDPEKVVPCTMELGTSFTTLVITGPNTGGKTVTLKTVGLLTLMAQAGLQIPGELGTELSVFHEVFADIGDEQSIEQSLSTFSSHMTNIVSIMEQVSDQDLVLFDELGAGTDPTEGAALAQAILQSLLNRKIRTVATTHYSELKAFALTTAGAENASVEFDVATLRPTYRLSIGVPGKSNAFEISRKLGLNESLIEDARKLLSHEAVRFEDVIANAEYHKQVAEKERILAEQTRQETVRLRQEAEKLYTEMEEKKRSATQKSREEAKRILENARREALDIVNELKHMKQTGEKAKAGQLYRQLEGDLDALSEGMQAKRPHPVPKNSRPLRAGDTVNILTFGGKGTVLKPADEKDEVLIQAGVLKIKVLKTDLELVEETKAPPKTHVTASKSMKDAPSISLSCDVRGRALDEAIQEVDLYLDNAVMAGYHEVTIVHGKGTGVLRAGIQQHLRKHPLVKSSRLGKYGEGEDGVTIVNLK